ncbi:DUF2326 domain-containing protein [Paenibacillus larvae]|uniref:DUF2326 domain-containing protein n=1 Tax=Paenibacillus larvae subsp. larvae TaxID=147375 RepID=A0A2L1U294_9BACL|nr:DUF2326 domain-containing protein [Paenibacillus larvae]AQZ45546.1 hypothetical protein B5S25_01980 [Paenibacillus larvae subsp. pulvifaciens]AVF27053.1 hypothetical protein ERICIII_02922 [Paenibacillus larvae subsp. larvae]AVF27533.1 hypothetical protein ERICIII_03423 [Paenibacillus larvae subsp. larvae]MBH0342777.1 hypothetical protein [Paenibacillus larvae]MBH0342786.1 hypothetical protein [Paenibacillus larvae]
MYLKQLIITSFSKIIRKIEFHLGANLIVDETRGKSDLETGNNIGKTTVLALIDYCLGGDAEIIYIDPETRKEIDYVKRFLIEREVMITLVLKEDITTDSSREIVIKRNFLQRSKKIMSVNGENLTKNKGKDFEKRLDQLIVGERETLKPSLRQLLAHYVRYQNIRINNTLKALNTFTTNIQYETLYLFMFGLPVSDRSHLNTKLKGEEDYKKRLEKLHSKNELELQLDIVKNNIAALERRKSNLNINENYKQELEELNDLKYRISTVSSRISELTLREQLLLETEEELKSDISEINLSELREIYKIAKKNISDIQTTFEQLVDYHNKMILEKIRFITQDIPRIRLSISEHKQSLEELLDKEKHLSQKISGSDTFQDLEGIISELTKSYQRVGELESGIKRLESVEKSIKSISEEITLLEGDRFSGEFQERLKSKLKDFNGIFAKISNQLYGEQYGISFTIAEDKKTKQDYYKFESFNANTSSGKKQGEIICFDIAYILFARKEGLPSLNFILNDKKELMHGNQLKKVSKFAKENKIQLVFSILKDKLPSELNSNEHIVLRLSDEDKLFRIEN